jgi:3-oxoadipate enol-lactonase
VIAAGGVFGDFPDPTPEETAARAELHAHVERTVPLLAAEGIAAYAAADIAAWGAALGPADRRKMEALQIANRFWIELPESLGADLDPPVRDRFAELTVPVDVVAGEHDFAGTRLWARRLAAQAPKATLVELPGADHFPMLSAPEAFDGVVRAALNLL